MTALAQQESKPFHKFIIRTLLYIDPEGRFVDAAIYAWELTVTFYFSFTPSVSYSVLGWRKTDKETSVTDLPSHSSPRNELV